MIRRLFAALRRGTADPAPPHLSRPNELNREVTRAERMRRELREPLRQTTPQPGTERAQRTPVRVPPAPAVPSAPPLTAALKSRSHVRQALLLKEILGPPAALRWPRDRDPEL